MIWLIILGIYLFPIISIFTWFYIIAEPGDSLWDVICEQDLDDILWGFFVPLLNLVFLGIVMHANGFSKTILSKFVKGKKKK